jgi:hypothetical protein
MTLQNALAVYLYFWEAGTLEERDEPVLEVALEIIEREARKAIAAHSGKPPTVAERRGEPPLTHRSPQAHG